MKEKETAQEPHTAIVTVESAADDISLASCLQHEGFQVSTAIDGQEVLQLARSYWQPDIVLLDLTPPEVNVFSVCERVRATNRTAVIFVLNGESEEDEIRSLEAGADDYLAKPFDLAELEARVRALTRRGMAGSPTLLQHGALKYDQIGRVASLNGQPLELSAREVSLLEVFLQRAGRLVSKDQLVSHLCEWGEEVSPNAIEVYVHRLRKKLEPGGVRIVTVRGLGYSLEKPVSPTV